MSSTKDKVSFRKKSSIVTDTFKEAFHIHPNLARLKNRSTTTIFKVKKAKSEKWVTETSNNKKNTVKS